MQIILWKFSGNPLSVNNFMSHLCGTESNEEIWTKVKPRLGHTRVYDSNGIAEMSNENVFQEMNFFLNQRLACSHTVKSFSILPAEENSIMKLFVA